jgi:hypothetical protein
MLGQGGIGIPNLAALSISRVIPAQTITVGLLDNGLVTSFAPPVLAAQAAQDISPNRFDDSLTDAFYVPVVDQEALAGQILVGFFNSGALAAFPAPIVALEAAQALSLSRFNSGALAQFYQISVFGAVTDLTIGVSHFDNSFETQIYSPILVSGDVEPKYTYPIGRGLYSDYGIRASMTNYKQRMIIGRR